LPATPPTYKEYFIARGFHPDEPLGMIRRMFLDCWAEPGFHRFWRLWNPYFGWLLFLLYLRLGGKRYKVVATMSVYVVSGFLIHDLPIIVFFSKPNITMSMTFFAFGGMVLFSKRFEKILNQEHWPVAINVILNFALLAAGATFGVLTNHFLLG